MNEWVKLTPKISDNSAFRDLRINNVGISSFDAFWDVSKRNLEVMQATAADDRRYCNATAEGSVVVNMRLASARDLYKKWKSRKVNRN